MPPRVLFFAGAPEARTLKWDSNAGLFNDFDESFERFIGISHESRSIAKDNDSTTNAPYWRSIPYERQHLATGHSQNIWKENLQGAQFFATSYIDSLIGDISATQIDHDSSVQSFEEVLSQFYEESYGLHQDVPSSQLQAVSQSSSRLSNGSSSYDTTDSSETNANTVSITFPQEDIPNCQLSSLKEIPNAKYIDAINPQTLTVNIIVGLIAVPEARLIRTRRGADVKLVEVIVGDEAKSGFVINFWISSTAEDENPLTGLRPQDIVLLRNVALSSFRGRVYGQSLRKNMTKVHLLYRNKLDGGDVGGFYKASDFESHGTKDALLAKTSSVRDWVKLFVSAPIRKHDVNMKVVAESLPPDTPP